MSYNDVNYEWTKKGGALSDKTAFEDAGFAKGNKTQYPVTANRIQ